MVTALDFRENRMEGCFELALSCGCNVTLPMSRSLVDFLRDLLDLQLAHTCKDPEISGSGTDVQVDD